MNKAVTALSALALCLSLAAPARAEKGEFQHYLGAGLYLPWNISTNNMTYATVYSLMVAGQTFFGVSDNFDVGLQLDWSYFDGGNVNNYQQGDVKGTLWYDYQRWGVLALVRWNWLPGYSVAPHFYAGAGCVIDKFTDQKLVSDIVTKNFPDYVQADWMVQGGIDLTWRFWWHLLFKIDANYTYSPISSGVALMGWFGIDWYVNTAGMW